MSPTKERPESEPQAPRLPLAGETLHFLVTGLTHPRERSGVLYHEVCRRGQELVLSERIIEACRDRVGTSWLDLLHDPAAQVKRFGRELIAPGPAPEGTLPEVGSAEFEDASREAYSLAAAIKDDGQRRAALAQVEQRFGPRPPTSRTVAHYGQV